LTLLGGSFSLDKEKQIARYKRWKKSSYQGSALD